MIDELANFSYYLMLRRTSAEIAIPMQLLRSIEEISPITFPSCRTGEPLSPLCGISEHGKLRYINEAPALSTLHLITCISLASIAFSNTAALPNLVSSNVQSEGSSIMARSNSFKTLLTATPLPSTVISSL